MSYNSIFLQNYQGYFCVNTPTPTPTVMAPRTLKKVRISTYLHPKKETMMGRRKGLTDRLQRKVARAALEAPLSRRCFKRGYQAKIGPAEMIPAVADKKRPLKPASLPRKFMIFSGLRKRFMRSMKMKTSPRGTAIWPAKCPQLFKASVVLRGETI